MKIAVVVDVLISLMVYSSMICANVGGGGGGGALQVANAHPALSNAANMFVPYENPAAAAAARRRTTILPEMMAKPSSAASAHANGEKHTQMEMAREIRRQRVETARREVEFINRHTNGLWKAEVFLPIAEMSDAQQALLFKTRLPSAEEIRQNRMEIMRGDNGTTNSTSSMHQRNRRAAEKSPPAEFDAATQWPECAELINQIANQGECGSCWAMASAAVMTDRICIWRLRKMRGAIDTWKYVRNIFGLHGASMTEWTPYVEEVEKTWKTSRRVFAHTFADSENNELTVRDKRQLKQTWFKLAFEKWLSEQGDSVDIRQMADKLQAFTQWHTMENARSKLGRYAQREPEPELRRMWCRVVHRGWGSTGANLLRVIFTREFGEDFQWKLRQIRANDDTETEMKMLSGKLMAESKKSPANEWAAQIRKYGEQKLDCLLQEFVGGHWDTQLGLLATAQQSAEVENAANAVADAKKMEKIMAKWMNGLWIGRRMVEGNADEKAIAAEWAQWEAAMLQAFKRAVIGPNSVVSAFHLLTCALKDSIEDKCDEGSSGLQGFQHARNAGIVSGTATNSGCKPYTVRPISALRSLLSLIITTPATSMQAQLQCHPTACSNVEWTRREEKQAKLFIYADADGLLEFKEEERPNEHATVMDRMMRQLMEDGPVYLSIHSSRSIQHYKSGIYKRSEKIQAFDNNHQHKYIRTAEQAANSHAVRLVGWGQETLPNGELVKFWRVANSWGAEWGEQGHFRIVRGENELGIENLFIYPMPSAWMIA